MAAATKQEIREWLTYAKREQPSCTHVIVVCDTFDHEDYPVFVTIDDDVDDVIDNYNGVNDQQVVEVYDLRLDIESQLAEERAFHC